MTYTITRRAVLRASALTAPAVLGLTALPARGSTVLKRKNIDDLTADELSAYLKAVQILKDRSAANPADPAGYDYQAQLHNLVRTHPDGSAGACEHGSEEFLPWHRAHLFLFEKLLQAAAPDTANVTIPYWDWTRPPSGARLPAAFEDTGSPLHHVGRWPAGSGAPDPIWDAGDVKTIVAEQDWNLFAGNAKSMGPTFGDLEGGPHNTMHGNIGPTMGDPNTAAEDPVYWSFHSYIDLVWSRWQRRHTQIYQCGGCNLWLEPDNFEVAHMTRTTDYGYEYDYDFSIDGSDTDVILAGGVPLTTRDSAARTLSAGPSAGRLAADDAAPQRTLLRLDGIQTFADVTYRLNIFVHPTGADLAAMDDATRDGYLVAVRTIWRQHKGHSGADTRPGLYVDITKALDFFPGGGWEASVIAESVPLSIPGSTATERLQTDENSKLEQLSDVIEGLSVETR